MKKLKRKHRVYKKGGPNRAGKIIDDDL